ncbi:MAG: hypothetical protein AB7F96_15495 [Beijerinckiaceae bacterium]
MTDRPILFSAPMVRALLDGRKTQTRRVLKPQPDAEFIEATFRVGSFSMRPAYLFATETHWMLNKLPRIGDRLWVRERTHIDGNVANYAADCDPARDLSGLGYRPSIHMPKWASRLTLVVTDVRVQRLQEISEADAKAEGAEGYEVWAGPSSDSAGTHTSGEPEWVTPGEHFREIWRSINGEDSWQANPWIAAYSFTVHRCNIDAMEAT